MEKKQKNEKSTPQNLSGNRRREVNVKWQVNERAGWRGVRTTIRACMCVANSSAENPRGKWTATAADLSGATTPAA